MDTLLTSTTRVKRKINKIHFNSSFTLLTTTTPKKKTKKTMTVYRSFNRKTFSSSKWIIITST